MKIIFGTREILAATFLGLKLSYLLGEQLPFCGSPKISLLSPLAHSKSFWEVDPPQAWHWKGKRHNRPSKSCKNIEKVIYNNFLKVLIKPIKDVSCIINFWILYPFQYPSELLLSFTVLLIKKFICNKALPYTSLSILGVLGVLPCSPGRIQK